MAIGGYKSVEAFVEDSEFGITRVRELYRGHGDEPRAWELRAVAETCGVPYGIFVLDLNVALDERRDAWQHSLEETVSRLDERLSDLSAELAERDLEDADSRRQGAGTGARGADDPDAAGEEG